ncbi:MAG: carbon starvation CstA family protein [Enterocloster clostridioformis]
MVLIYYFIATFVPIDKVIGKIYPYSVSASTSWPLGVGGAIILGGYHIPEIYIVQPASFRAPYIWPTMFISVACGAISGFHRQPSLL